MAQAKEEASRTIELARQQAEALVEKETVTLEAKHRADQIVEQARMEAENIKAGADEYAMEALANLEQALEQILAQVRNGKMVLLQKRPAAEEPKPQS